MPYSSFIKAATPAIAAAEAFIVRGCKKLQTDSSGRAQQNRPGSSIVAVAVMGRGDRAWWRHDLTLCAAHSTIISGFNPGMF